MTVIFFVAFALWFTATRYSSPSFYTAMFAPVVGNVLELAPPALFVAVLVIVVTRAVKTASFPLIDFAVAGCALVGFDLFWRYGMSRFGWEVPKLASLILDIASPIIVALGFAAFVVEMRRAERVETR